MINKLKSLVNHPLAGEVVGGTVGIVVSILLGGFISAKAESAENVIIIQEDLNEKDVNTSVSE